MMSLGKFGLLLAGCACACSSGGSGPVADLVIDNARIWTVDPDQPTAEALAVLGDRIVAVGSSSRVASWRGGSTRVVDGKRPDGWVPEQTITLEEALYAYTMGSAYAEFQEREKGSITPGKLADVVMLGEDIVEIAPERWPEVEVDMTIVGGRNVYEREG